MVSINRVRNTVLFLLEKNNRGFISPMEFDSFANLAQLEIFENLFFQYNKWVNNQYNHLSGAEFSDIPKNIKEQIDFFLTSTIPSNFTYDETDDVWTYTGVDNYRTYGLSLLNASGKAVDIEEVSKGPKWNSMINSKLNAPTTTYPIYCKINESYRVAPKAPSGYKVELNFIRTPKHPKWSYVQDADGNPMFNAGASDKQDFEIEESLYYPLVMKILSFCGLSVKENEIVAVAANAELAIDQKQS